MNQSDDTCSYIETVIVIDNANNTIIRDQIEFRLEPLMLRLLAYFRFNQQQIITRQQLMEHVWQSTYTSDAAINRSISELRKALGGERNSIIKTLSKKGYRFTAPQGVIFEEVATVEESTIAEKTTIVEESAIAQDKPITSQSMPQSMPLSMPPLPPNSMRGTLTATNKAFIAFGLISLIIIVLFASQLTKTNNSSKTPQTIEKSAITLAITPLKQTDSKRLNQTFKQSLQAQIINRALQIKDIDVISQTNNQQAYNQQTYNQNQNQNQQTQANFTLTGIFGEVDDNLNFTVQLIDNQSQKLRYSAALHYPLDNLNQATQDLSAEIAAIIRLWLLQHHYVDTYINALDPLTHQDIEKLVNARQHIDTKTPNGSLYAKKTLALLNQQYPNTSEILGLLSIATINDIHQNPNINHSRQLQFDYANKALTLNPKNFDALISLFYYHIKAAHLREKAHKFASNLLRHHPNRKPSWRAQLYLLIDNVSPCNDIRQFIDNAPKGIFNPKRQQTIYQILDHCQYQQPLPTLLNSESLQANIAKNKATYRNAYLFRLKNDDIMKVIDRNIRTHTSPKRLLEKLDTQYTMADTVGAKNTMATITAKFSPFWQEIARLYRHFYTDNNPSDRFALNEITYTNLYGDADLIFTAHLINQVNTNKLAPNALKQYSAKRPKFKINLQNRKETLALMMVQHASGEQQQSQLIAHRLFEQLEQYRLQYPASFHFWSLGRYHLTARLYCADSCKTLTDEHYLREVFSPTHAWWSDNSILMTQILAHWNDEPLVKTYLNQLKQDQIRIKQKIGL